MNKTMLASGVLLALAVALPAQAAVKTYNITTTWYEPATAPRDSIFIGSFDYDASAHTITNLKGILSESMSGALVAYDPAAGPGNRDSMTWLGLNNTSNAVWGATQTYGTTHVSYTQDQIEALHVQYNIAGSANTGTIGNGGLNNQLIPSWYDAALGGTFAVTFRNASTLTFSNMAGGDGWSPQAGVDNGGVYANFPVKRLNPGNAYALIFVPDSVDSLAPGASLGLNWNESNGTGDLGLAYSAYADFVPTVNPQGSYDFGGGMMGAVGMTGWSTYAYGEVGTMGGVPLSSTITAAVPEPESYAMLMAGLGIMGFIARRRRQPA